MCVCVCACAHNSIWVCLRVCVCVYSIDIIEDGANQVVFSIEPETVNHFFHWAHSDVCSVPRTMPWTNTDHRYPPKRLYQCENGCKFHVSGWRGYRVFRRLVYRWKDGMSSWADCSQLDRMNTVHTDKNATMKLPVSKRDILAQGAKSFGYNWAQKRVALKRWIPVDFDMSDWDKLLCLLPYDLDDLISAVHADWSAQLSESKLSCYGVFGRCHVDELTFKYSAA